MTVSTALADAVERLAIAADTGVPCAPVRDVIGADDVATAYRVQSALIARRLQRGATRVGRKIGLTSPAVQAQLGVHQPDFGVLLDDMVVPDGGTVPLGRLLQPKVEGEIAFRLGADLTGDINGVTVRAAVASAHAAIEIVDSRVAGWDIRIADTVADNASSGMFVISEHAVGLDEFEPVSVEMTLEVNGTSASAGNGAACLGDPLLALEWLARTAAQLDDPLRAGELVLSGALGPMVVVAPGDRVDVQISGLGAVGVAFGNEEC
ncbi:MAG: fumarylacetoacetate hydrolase family protein [Actinomycetota bacterium]|nr:fumarylacetoacetate hydrolase family protein [Actinomycetota bacterium]